MIHIRPTPRIEPRSSTSPKSFTSEANPKLIPQNALMIHPSMAGYAQASLYLTQHAQSQRIEWTPCVPPHQHSFPAKAVAAIFRGNGVLVRTQVEKL